MADYNCNSYFFSFGANVNKKNTIIYVLITKEFILY